MRTACLTALCAFAVLSGCERGYVDPYKRQEQAQANLPADCRYIDRPMPIEGIPGHWCDDNQYGIPGVWGTGPIVTPEGDLLDPIVLDEDETSWETVNLDLVMDGGYAVLGESYYREVFGDPRSSNGAKYVSSMTWGPGPEPLTWVFDIGSTERREGFTMHCEEWEDPWFLAPNRGWASVLMCDVPYIDAGRVAFIPALEIW
jgi:hypothetical protein